MSPVTITLMFMTTVLTVCLLRSSSYSAIYVAKFPMI